MNSFQDIDDFIAAYDSFIITTHIGPDADGIGSEVELYAVLHHLGKKVHILNTDPVPPRFAFIDTYNRIVSWHAKKHFHLPEQGGLIIVDTSDEFNLGIMLDEALPRAQGVFFIDHHEPSPFTHLAGYVDIEAASTTQIITEFCQYKEISINKEMAVAGYAGLIYDTGCFIYPKTTAKTFETALMLVQAGAMPNQIYQDMFENNSLGSLLLEKRVLSSLEILGSGRIAIQVMTKEDLLDTGANYEDAEHFINTPLKSKDIEVSIVIKQNLEGHIRCSLRSKGTVNVSLLAQAFGGGGHKTAAGFKSSLGLEETKAKVIQKVVAALGIQ
ncbi:MAG: bifunctional oligoribonuclease/PAP phosphatase NrnA [Termitinemataceae bacterium]